MPYLPPVRKNISRFYNLRNGIPGIDQYTVLMLHMDGVTGGQVFNDSSYSKKVVAAAGDAKTTNLQYKFGGTSVYLDGTGDYIETANSADFELSGDFTFDWWQRLDPGTTGVFGQSYFNSGADYQINIQVSQNAGKLRVQFGDTTAQSVALDLESTTATGYFGNTWVHCAIVRSGNTITIYKNGVADGSGSLAVTPIRPNVTFKIGRTSTATNIATGYIDEFRVSKGIARWTANFTPPSRAYR